MQRRIGKLYALAPGRLASPEGAFGISNVGHRMAVLGEGDIFRRDAGEKGHELAGLRVVAHQSAARSPAYHEQFLAIFAGKGQAQAERPNCPPSLAERTPICIYIYKVTGGVSPRNRERLSPSVLSKTPRPATILPIPNATRSGRGISDQGLATTQPSDWYHSYLLPLDSAARLIDDVNLAPSSG